MKKLNKKENEDVKFVLKFNKIRLSKLCERLNLSRSSINAGNGRIEDYHKVRKEIENEIARLYLKE